MQEPRGRDDNSVPDLLDWGFEDSAPKGHDYDAFWTYLRSCSGTNEMGLVSVSGAIPLLGNSKLSIDTGFAYAVANSNGACVQISLTREEPSANARKVFWLTWERYKVMTALRSDYEDKCDIFMTPKLEGCRFVIDETSVRHVAADSGHKSAGRDEAELAVSGPFSQHRRKVSISQSDGDDSYFAKVGTGTAQLFGIKVENKWIYKWLKINRDGAVKWTIINI
ncbi:hypothetical protein PQR67_05415 [Paraburkholderia fungorum]|uniref:hypothetical protein n=1 Tax=Paraburkholderia fungorum TaxID=134537 RepID=UPI0038BB5C88